MNGRVDFGLVGGVAAAGDRRPAARPDLGRDSFRAFQIARGDGDGCAGGSGASENSTHPERR